MKFGVAVPEHESLLELLKS